MDRRPFQWVRVILLLGTVGVLLGATTSPHWPVFRKSATSEEYACKLCGSKKQVLRRSIANISYYKSTTQVSTVISQAFAQIDKRGCHHQWALIAWGRTFVSGSSADRGAPFAAKLLLLDENLAAGLKAVAHTNALTAHHIWSSLFGYALIAHQTNIVLESFYEGGDRPPLAEWYSQNEGKLELLPSR